MENDLELNQERIPRTFSIRGVESRPANRAAACAVAGGYTYERENEHNEPIWDAPPPTVRLPKEVPNLIGTTKGRSTIVGFLGKKKMSKGWNTLWLARCVCGKYMTRQGAKWRKGLRDGKPDGGCSNCQKTDSLRERNKWYGTQEFKLGLPSPIPAGMPCDHPGCKSHVTHPCEGCGRQWSQ